MPEPHELGAEHLRAVGQDDRRADGVADHVAVDRPHRPPLDLVDLRHPIDPRLGRTCRPQIVRLGEMGVGVDHRYTVHDVSDRCAHAVPPPSCGVVVRRCRGWRRAASRRSGRARWGGRRAGCGAGGDAASATSVTPWRGACVAPARRAGGRAPPRARRRACSTSSSSSASASAGSGRWPSTRPRSSRSAASRVAPISSTRLRWLATRPRPASS